MGNAEENAVLLAQIHGGDRSAEDTMVRKNMALVHHVAQRFVGRGQDLEDLVQIGCLGLLKAIRGYDASYQTAFSTYAVPLILGEIKRFLRDDGLIKVSREAKRNYAVLMHQKRQMMLESGQEPRLEEICAQCHIAPEDAVYAIEACHGVVSLQEKIDEQGHELAEFCEDVRISDVTEQIALRQAMEHLEKQEQKILYLRYFRGLSQSKVAERLGCTQVKVSRTESKIREKLRRDMACE